VVGKTTTLQQLLAVFLSRGGHVLIEDYPGLAKTLIANSFATALGLKFKRIQFTPDLLPGDITGGYIYDNSRNTFVLREGPIFTNILLADEINRASPKTQSLLELQEYHVSLEGNTLGLRIPSCGRHAGPDRVRRTFPAEAQLTGSWSLHVGYPSIEEEIEIVERRRMRRTT
jgi:MoxR-like ATPase